MKIKTLPLGPIQANCYILLDEASGEAAVIDPGEASDWLLRELRSPAIRKVRYILLTHGHFDHILGVAPLKEETGAQIGIHPADADCLTDETRSMAIREMPSGVQKPVSPDFLLEDGMKLPLGGLTIEVLATPGHTKGGVCFLCGDRIFSGDTLFCHTYGRTDFPGGDEQELFESLDKLMALPGDYTVLPGHNRGTTLGEERVINRYVRRKNVQDNAFSAKG